MSLENKVAVVTGGGRGMGRAIALKFAERGAKVVIASRTDNELKKVLEEVEALGGEGMAVAADVSKEADVQNLAKAALDRFKKVDILVNNAGITVTAPIVETPLEVWNDVIGTNLTGAYLCSKAVLPSMMKQMSGKIINISSMKGKRGLPGSTAYSASKFGIQGLTEALAKEVKPYNITVTVLFPGLTHSVMGDTWSDEKIRKDGLPERDTWLRPEDIADVVMLLASLDNRVSIRDLQVVPTTQLGTNI